MLGQAACPRAPTSSRCPCTGRDGGSGLSGWQPRAQHRGWRRICASAAKTSLGMHVGVRAWLGRGFPSYSLLTPTYCEGKTLPRVGTGRTWVLLCCERHKLSVNPVQNLQERIDPTGPDGLLQLVLEKSVNQPARSV